MVLTVPDAYLDEYCNYIWELFSIKVTMPQLSQFFKEQRINRKKVRCVHCQLTFVAAERSTGARSSFTWMVAAKVTRRMASGPTGLLGWVWDQSSHLRQDSWLVQKGKGHSIQSAGPQKGELHCPSRSHSGQINCLQRLSRGARWRDAQGFHWIRCIAALYTIPGRSICYYPGQCNNS